ncbi:hypothetical protein ACLOJK_027205 [Asimina triloba]
MTPPSRCRRPSSYAQPPSTTHNIRSTNAHGRPTHHCRVVVAPIRAIHHDGDDEHIPDPLRLQADVDHSGHTRRVFLARHQQIQLHPAPIVAHFKSQPMHILIHIFMDNFVGFDPKINHHKGHTKRFLLRPHLAIHFPKSIYRHFRHQQAPHQQIHAVHHVHKIEPVLKLSGPHPTNGEDHLPMLPHDARSSHLVQMLLDQTRRPSAHAARRHRLARPMPARCHRLARPLPAARHSACRQGRCGHVALTANHGDADIPCRHSYSIRTAIRIAYK